MKKSVLVGALGGAMFSTAAGAGDVYDYTLQIYSDAAMTDLMMTMTATVENEVVGKFQDGDFSLTIDFAVSDALVWWGDPEEEDADDVSDLTYSQFSEGLFKEVSYGTQVSFREEDDGGWISVEGLFPEFIDVNSLVGYTNLIGEGTLTYDKTDVTDIYTSSTLAMVPGPGTGLLLGLGSLGFGRSRRRR